VVVVQTTGDGRADLLTRQGGRYHILVRGRENGRVVERVEEAACIGRALPAATAWEEIRVFARSPKLRYVISNTTEAGYNLDPTDRAEDRPPRSFPAKLLALLRDRFEAGAPGLTILPCELIEHQADKLLGILLQLAAEWQLPSHLAEWLQNDCVWLNTLVDRIVAATPTEHPLYQTDPLLTAAEPFAFWAIQDKPKA